MAARGSRDGRRTRTDAERARLYAARTSWHEGQVRRRRRDTIIAVLVGGVIVAGTIVSQVIFAQVNAPVPAPTPTSTQVPTETPTDVPTDGATEAPTDPATTPAPTLTYDPSGQPEPVPTQTLDE